MATEAETVGKDAVDFAGACLIGNIVQIALGVGRFVVDRWRHDVIADRQDAWNLFPKEPIGAVYLRKTDKGEVIAFNVICPHLGCAVDYSNSSKSFKCPCHDSSFTLDGAPSNSIPPRGMDTLEVDPARLKQGEVWVKFENFRTGEAHKVPKV